MRQIKFRAWHKAHKFMKMCNLYVNPRTGVMEHAQLDGQRFMMTIGLQVHVMQWTGLHDKNGKEIYEEDFLYLKVNDAREELGFHEIRLQVSFKDGSFGWIGDISGQFYAFVDEHLEEYEVCGNIWENPEWINA